LPHPDLYDRIIAAGVTPLYERPRPPRKISWTTFVLAFVLIIQVVIIASIREASKGADQLTSQ